MAIIVGNDTRLVVQGLTATRGLASTAFATARTARTSSPASRPARAARTSKVCQCSTRSPTRCARQARTRRSSSCPRASRPTRSTRRSTRDRNGDLHHRAHPRARHAPRLHVLAPEGRHADRAELPRCALAGKANVGIIPAEVFQPGSIGLVSRSGTLTYQIGNELAQRGLGDSTIVGIGGDPVVGSSFIDILEKSKPIPRRSTSCSSARSAATKRRRPRSGSPRT